MVAFAMHLLRTIPGLREVSIHPDGEHGKRFDFQGWLGKRGFTMKAALGKTSYGGTYVSPAGKTVVVNQIGPRRCGCGWAGLQHRCRMQRGNRQHPACGQTSRLRQGLCETIGLSLASPAIEGRRQFAVVPRTRVTESLARRMAARARSAGIEIALVDARGNVFDVTP